MTEKPRDPLRREGRMLVILGGVLLALSLGVAVMFLFNNRDLLDPSRGPVVAVVGTAVGLAILAVGVVRLIRTRGNRH